MKKVALLLNYLTFLVLFTSLMFSSSSTLDLLKLLLVFVASAILFRITTIYNGNTSFHRFNYLFVGTSAVFACFVAFVNSPLTINLLFYLWGASLIGIILSYFYKQPVVKKVKLQRPSKPVPATKSVTKKVVSKEVSTKKVSKAPVKKVTTKVASKKVAKKTTKKVAKKTTTKKTAKNAVKKSSERYVPKRTMTKKVATKRR